MSIVLVLIIAWLALASLIVAWVAGATRRDDDEAER